MYALSSVPNLKRAELAAIADALALIRGGRPKVTLQHAPGAGGKPVIVGVCIPAADLALDLDLETEAGWTTVGALYAAGAGHTRCQSPFRESSSWAAFYNVHVDGMPFVYDTGTGLKHVLRTGGRVPMWRIILEWLIEDLDPRFTYPDGAVFSERLGHKIGMREVRANHQVLDRLVMASDAPWSNTGVKRLALPTEFRKWLEVAWDAMVRGLPLEDDADAGLDLAGDTFKQQLEQLLKAMVPGDSGTWRKRALGTWCHWHASLMPREWRRVGSYDAWGLLLDDAFQIALLPTLAGQVSRIAHPEIADMTRAALTKRCRRYGIMADGDNRIRCGGRRHRAVILSHEFVASLDLSLTHDDELAAALSAAQSARSPSGAPH